jgi:hypothetical protein
MNLAGYPSYLVFDNQTVLPKDYEKYCGKQPLTNPLWKTPVLKGKIKPEDIVIYMEGKGNVNPLGASKIIRYFGYYPSKKPKGYWGGSRIPASEMVVCMPFVYKELNEYYDGLITKNNIIHVPTIEPGLFHPETKTIISAYYLGKGKRLYNNTENVILPKDAFEIEENRPTTRQGLANILNHTQNLYLFDPETAMAREGQLAGCNVFFLYDHDQITSLNSEITTDPIQNPIEDQKIVARIVDLANNFFGADK